MRGSSSRKIFLLVPCSSPVFMNNNECLSDAAADQLSSTISPLCRSAPVYLAIHKLHFNLYFESRCSLHILGDSGSWHFESRENMSRKRVGNRSLILNTSFLISHFVDCLVAHISFRLCYSASLQDIVLSKRVNTMIPEYSSVPFDNSIAFICATRP